MAWGCPVIVILAVSLCLVSLTASDRLQHIINVTVNGSDDFTECPKGNCSLVAAFRALTQTKEFKSSTEIRIAPGNYKLNVSFSFRDFNSLTIGTAPASISNNIPQTAIQCQGNNSGFSFYECRNIVVQGILLASCGALYKSSSYNNPFFYSALFIENTNDFKLDTVFVKESTGVGVTIYDTTGNVIVHNVVFEKNGPNAIDCQNKPPNASQIDKHIARAGGGLIIEFTYSNNSKNNSGGNFRISNSKFTGNIAPFSNLINATFNRPGQTKHIGFGRGGGLALYLRGSAQNNTFLIHSCLFDNNNAIWGGGYFIQFLDNVQENNVTIINTNATSNNACFGGGGFEISSVTGIYQQPGHFSSNELQSIHCLFSNNSAVSGGGGTIFGRSSQGYENDDYQFLDCKWDRNRADMGSAITLKLWDYGQGLFGPNSPFKVILTNCDIIGNTMRGTETNHESGLGAIYDFLVPLWLKNVSFIENTNTSLVIDTSSVTIMDKVTFSRNTGFKGGAVAMYGESCFNLTKGSILTFVTNIAKEKGGAIFVETPGPEDIPNIADNYLHTHECFFKYEDKISNPNEWQAKVDFIDNDAPPATGYSVFANTLQYCVYPGDTDLDTVLQWDSFNYYVGNSSNSSLDRDFEITTDAVTINFNESEWNVPPDQKFSPHVSLLDEKNNSVYGIVRINIQSDKSSPVTLEAPSPLFLVKDNISFLELKGNSGANFSVQMRTVGSQVAEASLKNISLRKCNPGFTLQEKECVCLSYYDFPGVSRCSEDGLHVYLEKGYWAGEVIGQNGEMVFVTAQCPNEYCSCVQTSPTTLGTGECIYDSSKMCDGNRAGVLCGSCKNGYDVQLGVQDCSPDCDNSDLWRLAPLLLFLTILVFFIFKVNIDIFTCYMNVWLYFYQVINLITGVCEEISLDPFITFVIGLANVTISGFGSCMWEGMDNLLKLAFSYLLPVYVLLVILIITLIAQRFPNSYFSRNSTFRATCTLFVLCYATLTRVSMEILRPTKIGDKIVVFSQGTVNYFSSYHCYFAIPAILILLFVVIPFPFFLMFTPFFIRHVKWIGYATPLFNTFQSCFQDGYRWFAAFYFFCRFIFLLLSTFIPYGGLKAIIMQVACVLVLSTHVYLFPYLPQYGWINTLDSLLLITLTFISVIAGQTTRYVSDTTKFRMVVCINILAYIPLIYVTGLAIYHVHLWLKKKFFVKEPEFCDLTNSVSEDTRIVKVI